MQPDCTYIHKAANAKLDKGTNNWLGLGWERGGGGYSKSSRQQVVNKTNPHPAIQVARRRPINPEPIAATVHPAKTTTRSHNFAHKTFQEIEAVRVAVPIQQKQGTFSSHPRDGRRPIDAPYRRPPMNHVFPENRFFAAEIKPFWFQFVCLVVSRWPPRSMQSCRASHQS